MVLLLAQGLGSGLAPRAPGTVGSLAALPFYLLLLAHLPSLLYLIAVALLFALGIPLCTRAERLLDSHDHPSIVFDEWVGVWVGLFALPQGWVWPWLGLALFRLFDIAKPWPVNWAERRLPRGWGVMGDDLLAGLYALIVVQAIAYFPSWTPGRG